MTVLAMLLIGDMSVLRTLNPAPVMSLLGSHFVGSVLSDAQAGSIRQNRWFLRLVGLCLRWRSRISRVADISPFFAWVLTACLAAI
jgi:hypothetical protein